MTHPAPELRHPDAFGLDHYLRCFGTQRSLDIIANSFAIGVTATAITLVLAYGFA